MHTKNIIKKISMVSAIAAIAIVAGMMAGCQKEIEDDEISMSFDSYKPVRLKSGGEKTYVGTYYVGPNHSSSELVHSIQNNSAYQVQIRPESLPSGFSATEVKISLNSGQSKIFLHPGNNYEPIEQDIYTSGGSGGGTSSFGITHTWGGPAEVKVYKYD